ncbi:hypothetical protein B566_EDAN014925 [Ephemera danica]|nr:hypothetical protein B566_EDAN014925 [Ephemera danica]
MRLYSYPLGVQWDVRGKEHMMDPRGCVIVVNHQSSLDILGLFWIWRYFHRMAAVAKKQIFYVWPFGLSAYLAGVPTNDESPMLHYTCERKPRRVVIEALPLISTSGLTSDDVDDLTRRVRDVMASRYDQLADELRASLPPDYPGL